MYPLLAFHVMTGSSEYVPPFLALEKSSYVNRSSSVATQQPELFQASI